jgi:FkbM family methyltransferase
LELFNKEVTFYLKNQLDFDLLQSVFVWEEYKFEEVQEPKVIFDLGSNIGTTVIYYKLKYPDAKIFAFEPDPQNFGSLVKNSSQFGDSVVVIPKAVYWEEVEEIPFYQGESLHWSSSLVKRDRAKRELRVPATTLDSAMRTYEIPRIDLLKFDIEGAEYQVFRNFKNLSNVDFLIGETHKELFGKDIPEFLSLFQGFDAILRDGTDPIVAIQRLPQRSQA